jgi:hypothetical protein
MAFLLSAAVAVCLHVNFRVYIANAHLITNLLEVLPLSFAMANAYQILSNSEKINNNGAPLDCFPFPTVTKASRIDGHGIFVRVAGFVAILNNINAPVVVDFLHSFFNDCLLLLQAIDAIKIGSTAALLCCDLSTAYSKVLLAASNGYQCSLTPTTAAIMFLLYLLQLTTLFAFLSIAPHICQRLLRRVRVPIVTFEF